MMPSDGDLHPQSNAEPTTPMIDSPAELEACDWYHAETHVITSTGEEWPAATHPQLRIHLEYTIAHLLRVVVEAPTSVWQFDITDPMRGHVEVAADDHELSDTKRAYLRWALDQIGVRLQRSRGASGASCRPSTGTRSYCRTG